MNGKRLFSYAALALLIIGVLGPFVLAALTSGEIALGYSVVATVLSLVFGILSLGERVGKVVTALSGFLAIAMAVTVAVLIPIRERQAALMHEEMLQITEHTEAMQNINSVPDGGKKERVENDGKWSSQPTRPPELQPAQQIPAGNDSWKKLAVETPKANAEDQIELRFLVLDSGGEPVANARVCLMGKGRSWTELDRNWIPEIMTDTTGLAQFAISKEKFAGLAAINSAVSATNGTDVMRLAVRVHHPQHPVSLQFVELDNPTRIILGEGSSDSTGVVEQLQIQELAAAAEAEAIRQLRANGNSESNVTAMAQHQQTLKLLVSTAFDLKLRLEETQVKSLHSQLLQLQRQIDQRKTLREKVIHRRVTELIEGQTLNWESGPGVPGHRKDGLPRSLPNQPSLPGSHAEARLSFEDFKRDLEPLRERLATTRVRVQELEPFTCVIGATSRN